MKVAVVGYGIEGEQSYRYWTRRGDDVTIVDEQVLATSSYSGRCKNNTRSRCAA